MPQYATSGTNSLTPNPAPPTGMNPGDSFYPLGTSGNTYLRPDDNSIAGETVAAGERSLAWALNPRPGGGAPAGCMVQIFANGSPTAEFDVQDAAVDADGAYLTPSGATYKISTWTQIGATGIYTAWAEFQPESGKFCTLKCISNSTGTLLFWSKVSYV